MAPEREEVGRLVQNHVYAQICWHCWTCSASAREWDILEMRRAPACHGAVMMNNFGIQAGELFATRNRDGSYRIVKVLVVEDDVAHIRIYAESFPERPVNLDVSTLTLGSVFTGKFGMGHLPLRLGSFLQWDLTLISRSELAEEELDGYQMWREAGGGVWD